MAIAIGAEIISVANRASRKERALQLEHEFEVPASPEQTLELLLDAERVVPCMPGAKLLEVVDDRTWKSELGIKLGPVAMDFLADVKMLDRDDDRARGQARRQRPGARQGRRRGHRRLGPAPDRLGRDERLHDDGPWLLGPGGPARPAGVVQDVSNKLVDQFAECIKSQLSAVPEERAGAVQEAQKPVSGFRWRSTALVGAIKRLFGIGRERGRPREAHQRHRQRRPARGGRGGA